MDGEVEGSILEDMSSTHHKQYCVNVAAQEIACVRICSWSSLRGQVESPGNKGEHDGERNEARDRYSMIAEQIPERHWGEGAVQEISGCLPAKCQETEGTALHPKPIHINLSGSDTFASISPVPTLG